MKVKRIRSIIVALLAVFAAVVLFITYGTVLPSTPFASIRLDGPSVVDSNGNMTAIADTESHRALILNADGDLTGVVSCMTIDAPFDAITDVCASDDRVYMSGVRFMPDSDIIEKERIAAYDKGGNLLEVVYEKAGNNSVTPSDKSLSDIPNGVAIAYDGEKTDDGSSAIGFKAITDKGEHELDKLKIETTVHDIAFTHDEKPHFATLSARGLLDDDMSDYSSQTYAKHVFIAIDIGPDGTLYACDDTTGNLCYSPPGSTEVYTLVEGGKYHNVHVSNGVISLCDTNNSKVTFCDTSGAIRSSFSEVKPSIGFSARMMLVWASGIYLAILAIVLVVRKVRRMISSGETQGIGPVFLALAVVSAMAIAIGGLSFSSYQNSLKLRASEINTCADYLTHSASGLSAFMESVNDRNILRGNEDELSDAMLNLIDATAPAFALVEAANNNGIGMYCNIYGKDEQGAFYLIGSSFEYVLGSAAVESEKRGLDAAFKPDYPEKGKLIQGRTMRDTAQYRFVQIPTADGKGVAGVVEIGSKLRSFESFLTSSLVQRVIALLVLVLVVYLTYSELRACARCLFEYRQRRPESPIASAAILTRPFTLSITMLTSIDSVMTVLIARDLLQHAGMGDKSPLLMLPAFVLGIGMIVGQGLYGFAGSRVGLRRLMAGGALAMLLCACFTCVAVVSSNFWLYCVAKLTMAMPFGMLYSMGYSLPRLADDDETRTLAAGGVKRTDTSAAALGTVLGGYAAQMFGNAWVYVLVALACIPVFLMALNLLPRGMRPLEALAQPDSGKASIRKFVRTRSALAIALFIVLPSTIAAGYASYLFPLLSTDLGLSKSDVNNIVVMGQVVVFVCINSLERLDARYGKWRVSVIAIALLGAVFLLFMLNSTVLWSTAVIVLVAVLCKASDGWKAMWLKAAADTDVPAGRATAAMFASRSLALIAQPFILGALLGVANDVAVFVIGLICAACAALFFLITRKNKPI